jgi:hypothetical protein
LEHYRRVLLVKPETLAALGEKRVKKCLPECPLLALSGHAELHCTCPLSGAKRTCRFALQMSAYDPKRTLDAFLFNDLIRERNQP